MSKQSEEEPATESESDRLDRELIELMNGLRVILPGVQVLFAFLLTVPFTNKFDRITGLQQDVFFAAFISTAIASALLIAPSSYHRLRWRQHDKEQLLRTSNRLSIAGTAFLAAAITCVVFVITDLVFSTTAAVFATCGVAVLLGWFWFGLPLSRFVGDAKRSSSREAGS